MAFSIFAQKIGNWFQWTNKYFLWCKIWKSSLTVPLGHLLWLVWGRKKFHKELFHRRFIKNFFTTPGFFIHKACHKAFFLAGRQFDDFLVAFCWLSLSTAGNVGLCLRQKPTDLNPKSKLMNWRRTLLEIIWQATHGDYTKLKYKN